MVTPRITPGAKLIRRIREAMAELDLEPNDQEVETLRLAGELEDLKQTLQDGIERDGATQKLETGRVVGNPAVGEVRQLAASIDKLIRSLSFNDDDEQAEPVQVDKRQQQNARKRWAASNAKKGRS